jgi:hypothetical protein
LRLVDRRRLRVFAWPYRRLHGQDDWGGMTLREADLVVQVIADTAFGRLRAVVVEGWPAKSGRRFPTLRLIFLTVGRARVNGG